METIIRTCDSSVEDFSGCNGEARAGTVSCAPCFDEYQRRSRALDRKRKEEKDNLLAILEPMAKAEWEDKPRVRVLKGNYLFGKSENEGKVVFYYGKYLILQRKNSTKGYLITHEVGNPEIVRLEVLDRNGKVITEWHSETVMATGSVMAKQLADQYEREGK